MTILALDLSLTATGYCYDTELTGIECGFWRTGLKGHARLEAIRQNVLRILRNEEPSAVFLEGFSFGSQGRAVYEIGGLGYIIRHELWKQDIPYAVVSPSSLKKYATGRGNANKDEMLAAAIRRFEFAGTDNNAADAWLLWHLGRFVSDEPVITVPKAHTDHLKFEWVSR